MGGLIGKFVQRMLVESGGDPAVAVFAELFDNAFGVCSLREFSKNAGAGAGHAGFAEG